MLPSRRSYTTIMEERGFPVVNRGLIAETGVIPTGMQLIRDVFPFEIIDRKETVTEDINGKEVPVMRVTGLFQMGDKENANQRYYPSSDVLAPAVRGIQEDVTHRAVMGEFDHPCLNTCTFRVLTVNDGWKEFVDVKVGDHVWSRINGEMVKSRVNAIVDEPYDGTAYRISGRNINVEFTPGHRFLFEKRPDRGNFDQLYATVQDVYENRRLYSHCRVPRTAKYNQQQSSVINIPATDWDRSPAYYNGDVTVDLVFDARDFAAFIGIYLAEGSLKRNGIQIDQTSESGKELIADLLTRIGLSFTANDRGFYISADKRLADYLRPLGDKYSKYIPQEIKNLSPDCLEQLIYWFAIGDGRMLVASDRDSRYLSNKKTISENGGIAVAQSLDLGKYSRFSIFTVSKRLINDLHECVIKIGRCGRLSEVVTEDDYVFADHVIKAENKSTLYQLHISRNKGFTLDQRFTSIEPFHHKGRIYCLSVDHGNFYMEHKGMSYWTGNSDAKIHLDRVSHLITKIWMDGKKVFGEAEVLHKLPCGSYLRGLFEHKVRVGISSRGVGDMEVAEHQGHQIYRVMPGYSFVTWDAVAEPSVNGAILQIQESLNRRLRPIKESRHRFSPQAYQNLLVKEIENYFGLNKRSVQTPVPSRSRR